MFGYKAIRRFFKNVDYNKIYGIFDLQFTQNVFYEPEKLINSGRSS